MRVWTFVALSLSLSLAVSLPALAEGHAGDPTPCESDADCGAYHVCVEGHAGDDEVATSVIVEAEDSMAEPMSCESDADCNEGVLCVDDYCIGSSEAPEEPVDPEEDEAPSMFCAVDWMRSRVTRRVRTCVTSWSSVLGSFRLWIEPWEEGARRALASLLSLLRDQVKTTALRTCRLPTSRCRPASRPTTVTLRTLSVSTASVSQSGATRKVRSLRTCSIELSPEEVRPRSPCVCRCVTTAFTLRQASRSSRASTRVLKRLLAARPLWRRLRLGG